MREIWKTAIALFVICVITTGAMAFTYMGTKDTIIERALIDEENARREVLADAEKFEEISDLSAITASNPTYSIVKKAFKGLKGDTVIGYVFTIDSKGYGGDIRIIVGVDNDGKVTRVKVGDNKETPGLGAKASQEPFISQFTNLAATGPLQVVKNGGTKPEEIDAISGATITSRAVVKAVQAAIDMTSELTAKGGK